MRWLERLRALAVCLSFALVCVPLGPGRELTWPGRAAVAVVLLPGSVSVRLDRSRGARAGGRRVPRSGVRAVHRDEKGGLRRAPRGRARNAPPGFDGRRLYLEQRALLC